MPFAICLLLFIATPHMISAATTEDKLFGACNSLSADQQKNNPVCASKGTTENPATHIINTAANIVALMTGIGAVIIIIISGFNFVTAGGNAEAAANARRRLTYAVVGLAVVALAWALTRFITDRVIQ